MTTHQLNPLTLEANYFINSLNAALSSNLNVLDAELVESLENVINTIDKFLEKSGSEIVATNVTKLVTVDDLESIKRIYHCTRCKRDLGKSASKVAVHLAEKCEVFNNGARADVTPLHRSEEKKRTKEERKEKRSQKKEQRFTQSVVLRKSKFNGKQSQNVGISNKNNNT